MQAGLNTPHQRRSLSLCGRLPSTLLFFFTRTTSRYTYVKNVFFLLDKQAPGTRDWPFYGMKILSKIIIRPPSDFVILTMGAVLNCKGVE